MESLGFVSSCVGPQRISYISMCHSQRKASSLSEPVAPTGGGDRLSCVGPGELGKTLGVPVEGCQLCWAYLSVWLPFFSPTIRDTRESKRG